MEPVLSKTQQVQELKIQVKLTNLILSLSEPYLVVFGGPARQCGLSVLLRMMEHSNCAS